MKIKQMENKTKRTKTEGSQFCLYRDKKYHIDIKQTVNIH